MRIRYREREHYPFTEYVAYSRVKMSLYLFLEAKMPATICTAGMMKEEIRPRLHLIRAMERFSI